jgi:hypothetical protein
MDSVYVVLVRSEDLHRKWVEIKAIVATRDEADAIRYDIFDRKRIIAEVERYLVMKKEK